MFIFGLHLCGCVHVHTLTETDIQNIQAKVSGAMLVTNFKVEGNIIPFDACTLTLRKADGSTDYQIDIHQGHQTIFVPLEPGIYRFYGYSCPGHKVWSLLWKGWPNFQVLSEKISVPVPTEFDVDENLMLFSQKFNRKMTEKDMSALFGRLSKASLDRLVSAYDQKPITLEMLQTKNEKWRVVANEKIAEEKLKQAKFPNFKSCYDGENLVNPLWIGEVSVEIEYKDHNFVEMKNVGHQHVFTEQFVNCAQKIIRDFKPRLAGSLNYQISL